MSPVGGVGINLAVADAVAAAAAAAEPLRIGDLKRSRLARVQGYPCRVIARAMHENVDEALKAPLAVRVLSQVPAFGAIAGYGGATGPLPEHAPAFAGR